MPTTQRMLECPRCGTRTLHLVDQPSHLLHLVLTVFTAGLWLLPWLLLGTGERREQCTACGLDSRDAVEEWKYERPKLATVAIIWAIVVGVILLTYFLTPR